MGKADQRRTQNAITEATDSLHGQSQQGIGDTSSRIAQLQPQSDALRSSILSNYGGIASTGGIDPSAYGQISTGFGSLTSPTGGFDPTRLANITSDTGALRNFASTGGVSAADASTILNPTLQEFSQTGGYSPTDIANIRARSNSPIASTYANLQNNLNIQRLAGSGVGPGWSNVSSRLARQGAQDIGTNAQNTEVSIADAVRQGRMSAADLLSQRGLGLAGLRSSNILSGYGSAANIDQRTQDAINQARLAGTQGQLDLARTKQGGMLAGAGGMLSTYGAAPGELLANQQLLQNYRNALAGGNANLINARIGASRIPGIGSTIASGLGVGQLAAGMGAGLAGAFGGGASNPLASYPLTFNWGSLPSGGAGISY